MTDAELVCSLMFKGPRSKLKDLEFCIDVLRDASGVKRWRLAERVYVDATDTIGEWCCSAVGSFTIDDVPILTPTARELIEAHKER